MCEIIFDGNELVVKVVIEVGCWFFGGYFIMLSLDIMYVMSVVLFKCGGYFI